MPLGDPSLYKSQVWWVPGEAIPARVITEKKRIMSRFDSHPGFPSGASIPAPPKEPSAIDRALAELSHKVDCLEEAWQVLSEKLEPVLIAHPPAVSAPEPNETRPMCQLESEIARQIDRIATIRLAIFQVASRVQL